MFVCGDCGMSDVWMLNNVGPSMDPYETAAKIGWKEEKLSFILTENCLLDRNEVRESSR